MAPPKKSQGRIIQSVERSINALKLFLKDEEEFGIKDFARELNLPKPTIYSLVNTLTAHELLEQNPINSKYRLGPVLFRLGLQYLRQSDVLTTVGVHLERLCYKFGKSVNLCMLVGGQVVVVFKADPEQTVVAYPEVGSMVPIHNTANGKVLLAHTDSDTLESILTDHSFPQSTPTTITDEAQFRSELDRVRKQGLGFSRGEGLSGIHAIAGPIYNHRDRVIASFAISGKADFFKENEDRLVGEVKKTAQAISRQLGYKGRIYP